MRARWSGPLVISLIFCGVALILILNLDLGGMGSKVETTSSAPSDLNPAPTRAKPAGFREYPIGDDVVKNAMRIAAVWLPPVPMEGGSEMPGASADMVHLEADIHAAEGNPNGFPRDEFVPYLTISYTLTPLDRKTGGPAGEVLRGSLSPMVARDGWHYGASLLMPGPGRYRLDYHLEPPSAGRHADAATGVAPWWAPFDVSFDWVFEGVPRSGT